MANMTRDNFRDELKKRGWSRFLDADLEKYCDWALQDLYAKSGYPRSVTTVSEVAGVISDEVGFDDFVAASELVRSVDRVFVEQGGKMFQLEPANESMFFEVIWPNVKNTANPNLAVPSHYYAYDLSIFLYQRPQTAVDLHVHYQVRRDTFSSGSDTSGLPERFDKGIVMLAEVHCYRRAHEQEGLAVAMASFQDFLMEELGMEGSTMKEEQERVMPWQA